MCHSLLPWIIIFGASSFFFFFFFFFYQKSYRVQQFSFQSYQSPSYCTRQSKLGVPNDREAYPHICQTQSDCSAFKCMSLELYPRSFGTTPDSQSGQNVRLAIRKSERQTGNQKVTTRDSQSEGHGFNPHEERREKNSSLELTVSAQPILAPVPPSCYRSSTQKILPNV